MRKTQFKLFERDAWGCGYARTRSMTFCLMLLVVGCSGKADDQPDPFPKPGPPHVYNGDPSWSSDGERILYLHYPQSLEELAMGGDRQIWLYDLTTGVNRFIVAGIGPVWMPDDASFLYTSQQGVTRYDLLNDTSSAIFSCGNAQWGRPSPDGRAITCDSSCEPSIDAAYHIWRVDLETGSGRQLGQQGTDTWRSAAWSPDGTRLAHVRYSLGKGRFELFVMDTSGTAATQLRSESEFDDYDVTWSRDGTWIYFARYGNSPPSEAGIWRIHPDGTGAELIVSGGSSPSCSPKDSAIVFGCYDQGTNSYDIWMSRADGDGLHRVFTPLGMAMRAAGN